MPKWLRALIAGYGAKKLGGGCFSTIIIFIVIYYVLGTCNKPARTGEIKTEQHSPMIGASMQKTFFAVHL